PRSDTTAAATLPTATAIAAATPVYSWPAADSTAVAAAATTSSHQPRRRCHQRRSLRTRPPTDAYQPHAPYRPVEPIVSGGPPASSLDRPLLHDRRLSILPAP